MEINKIYIIYYNNFKQNKVYTEFESVKKATNRLLKLIPNGNIKISEYNIYKFYNPIKSFYCGDGIMKVENYREDQDVWLTILNNVVWDGPHRRLATNKANITKYYKKNTQYKNISPHEFFKNCYIKKYKLKNKSGEWTYKETNDYYQITDYDNNKLVMSHLK
jgi:hypothetical protein